MATLPPKLYFRIGEVASLVGVEPHVLRYWEREFRSIRPTKSAKGQRVYSRRDVENLMRVRDLLYADGFTIAGAKKKLQRSGSEPGDPESARSAARSTLEAESQNAARTPDDGVAKSAAAAPHDAPPEHGVHVRTALRELRSEIEALLAELGG
jgi:DNA-binding transcriptional MerR regulator